MFNFKKKKLNKIQKEPMAMPDKMELNNLVSVASVDETVNTVNKETLISPGTLLCGEITNEFNITIEGTIEGDVISQKMVQIGKNGRVIGKIQASKVTINGYLKGSCQAHSITILSRGRVEGDIFAQEFSIERGGVFSGNSHHLEEEASPAQKGVKKSAEAASNVITPAFSEAEKSSAVAQKQKK